MKKILSWSHYNDIQLAHDDPLNKLNNIKLITKIASILNEEREVTDYVCLGNSFSWVFHVYESVYQNQVTYIPFSGNFMSLDDNKNYTLMPERIDNKKLDIFKSHLQELGLDPVSLSKRSKPITICDLSKTGRGLRSFMWILESWEQQSNQESALKNIRLITVQSQFDKQKNLDISLHPDFTPYSPKELPISELEKQQFIPICDSDHGRFIPQHKVYEKESKPKISCSKDSLRKKTLLSMKAQAILFEIEERSCVAA